MWVFPLLAALIAAAFAAVLGRRLLARRHAAIAMWTIALLMYSAASFAMFLGSLTHWSPAEFRVYWLLGAALNVPYLAQGELYLLLPRRAADVLFLALVLGTGFAVTKIASAPVHAGPLHDQLPLGREVFGAGTAAHRLPQLFSTPAYVVLVVGALWSARRMRGTSALRDRALGTIGIAAGATIVAVGSGIGAGFGVVWLFSTSLALGVAVMFWGFLRAG
jgi:hypothetical protein